MNLFTSPVPHRERSIFDRTLLRTDSPVYVIGAVNMVHRAVSDVTLRKTFACWAGRFP